MSNKKASADESQRKVNVARAQDYGIIYADSLRTTMSLYDIKLTFSVSERLPNDDVLITEIVTIALSPQHMKDITNALNRNVAKYERDFISLQAESDVVENRP